jgi:ABC-type antimicrobial peptide transport system permease subunit
MIKQYAKLAWRHIVNNKFYSLLNMAGLSVGMAVSFLLLLFVFFEFHYDKHNVNSERLFLVFKNQQSNGSIVTKPLSPDVLAGVLQKDIPEVEATARVNLLENSLINQSGNTGQGLKVTSIAADSSLLNLFTFDFLYGSKSNALNGSASIILTESLSKALFGNVVPVGKLVTFNNEFPLTVNAVIKDPPLNSSLSFKAIISWGSYIFQQPWMKDVGWWNFQYSTYVMLKPMASLQAVNGKIKGLVEKNDPSNKGISLFLYPLTKLHLYSEFENGVNKGGKIEYIRLFFFLAIGILIVACINFMNLSTARSEKRAKEVGVLKVAGAKKRNLIIQFIFESSFMSLMAFVLSLILLAVMLPYFNQITGSQLTFPFKNIAAWCLGLGISLFAGLLAGSYPAFVLSSFNPIYVLKGKLISINHAIQPRKILVVVQFTFAIALIIASMYIYKQINYIKERPIGYERFGLIEIPVDGQLGAMFDNFRKEGIESGAITDAATTSASITNNLANSWGVLWPDQMPGEAQLSIACLGVSYNFVKTYGLQIVEGRDFDIGRPGDSTGVLLNEAAVKLMRLKAPLGREITWMDKKRLIVGVVKNFVLASPFEPVKPVIIGFNKDWVGNAALRLNPAKPISSNIGTLSEIYKKYNPSYPFQYQFVDENFGKKFTNERLLGSISLNFTLLAIFISCLGLFGLASSSAERRTKELGIRKVLGASPGILWFSLTSEFLKLILLSFVTGGLLSWYFIYKWLNGYTYHIAFNAWFFVLALVLSVMICLLAISAQAFKAATRNPIKSLRIQ